MRTGLSWAPAAGLAALLLAGCGTGPHLAVPTAGPEHYQELKPLAIHAISPQEIVVVGHLVRDDGTPEGLILATDTKGRTWRRQASEVHDLARLSFHAVYYADRLRGWIAGIRVDDVARTRPTVFMTRDGGSHWREVLLPQDPGLVATALHSLRFVNDRQGAVSVVFQEPGSEGDQETVFVTQDGGRSWVAGSYRAAPQKAFTDQTSSFLDENTGFRLTALPFAGRTMLEISGSGGRDWMPVHEFSVGTLDTYYY